MQFNKEIFEKAIKEEGRIIDFLSKKITNRSYIARKLKIRPTHLYYKIKNKKFNKNELITIIETLNEKDT